MRILFFATALTLLSTPSISGPGSQAATVPSGTELIISHANYDPGVYLLKFTKYENGSVTLEPLNAQVVDLDGRTKAGPANPPDDGNETPSLLDQVRSNFDDDDLFEKQRTLMLVALDVPAGMTLNSVNAFVQGKMAITIGDYADEWKPWTDWFIAEAVKQKSLEDYTAWVALAKESLTE